MNVSYIEWRSINHGIPQGSFLGPLLFNNNINDLFMSVSNSIICNNVDDTTIYVSDYKNEEIIRKLERDTAILSNSFRDNSMKVNAEKCHLMFFSNTKSTNIEIENYVSNIQLLMIEKFKTQHSLNPTFMKEIFVSKNNKYALRNEHPIKFLRL